jgi:hypothetical protein
MEQLDNLFGHVSFYLERYPQVTRSDALRTLDLNFCVKQLGELPTELAKVLTAWKQGVESPYPKIYVEEEILIELWSNLQALIYFLTRAGIALDTIDGDAMTKYFYVIGRCNRVLT